MEMNGTINSFIKVSKNKQRNNSDSNSNWMHSRCATHAYNIETCAMQIVWSFRWQPRTNANCSVKSIIIIHNEKCLCRKRLNSIEWRKKLNFNPFWIHHLFVWDIQWKIALVVKLWNCFQQNLILKVLNRNVQSKSLSSFDFVRRKL